MERRKDSSFSVKDCPGESWGGPNAVQFKTNGEGIYGNT